MSSSSLNDTKWRNENTGDWDIGFFENFAVYDCQFWNYESINGNGDKYEIKLRNDEDLLVIKVDKEKNGKRNIQIGQSKPQLYSNITGRHIPYYPKTDVDTALIDNGYSRIDTVTIVGWLKDMPEKERSEGVFAIYQNNIYQNGQTSVYGEIDSIGRFTVKVPVINSHELFLRHGSTYISTVFEAGETYFLLYDFKTGQEMFMGKNSMLQNMYLTHQELFGRIAPAMNGSPSHAPYSSYDEFYKDSETFWGKMESDLDNIIHEHPTLSPKYINYTRHYWDVIKAQNLAQASNYLPNHRLPEAALNEIVEKYWRHLPRPYTAYCGPIFSLRISLLQQFMAKNGFDPNYITFQSIANDENLDISASQRETIKKYTGVIDEFRQKTEGLSDQDEIQKIAQAIQTEHQSDMQEMQTMLKDERLQNLINEKSYLLQLDYATHILDSIGSDCDMKDFFVGLDATSLISGNNHSLSPVMMEIAEKRISLPVVKDGVREMNQKFLDIESKNLQSVQSTGMSRGEALFHKLVEPYKGKIILADFWGTWCVPCLQALSKSQEEYQRLSKYDIVYMYFANKSPEAKWKDVIEQYQLKGNNVVHFNLEPEEENAIEQYFQVSAFPSYFLISQDGRLLPYKVDARKLDALEEIIASCQSAEGY